jgi:integrase
MPKRFPYKYVIEDVTDGVPRIYFRRRGQPKVRLHSTPGTPEFLEEYYRALRGEVQKKQADSGVSLSREGTFRWLCEQYFGSAEFKRLEKGHVRRRILELCWQEPLKPGASLTFGDMPLGKFDAKAVRVLRDRKSDLPESANGRVKAVRAVYSWATMADVQKAIGNPARDVKYLPTNNPEGHHPWTADEAAKFEERHPIGTKARLAFGLLYYLAQRRSDIVLFGRQHVKDGVLRFTQQKNRNSRPVTLELPVPPELQQIIDASPCGDLTFLVNDLGKPFTANGFGNKFREWCDAAGLPQCSAHGLRKARAAAMADEGATGHQIMAVTGHRTLKEVDRYTRSADQKRLAREVAAIMSRTKKG